MIYHTEALFVYNTQNSVTPDDVIDDSDKTLSPWIYSEIAMTNLVERRSPEKHRRVIKSMTEGREDFSELEITYNINISNLSILDADFINSWGENNLNRYDALDYLYQATQRRRL
jgi:hypothetical protein